MPDALKLSGLAWICRYLFRQLISKDTVYFGSHDGSGLHKQPTPLALLLLQVFKIICYSFLTNPISTYTFILLMTDRSTKKISYFIFGR